jgi:hypothetical protein
VLLVPSGGELLSFCLIREICVIGRFFWSDSR